MYNSSDVFFNPAPKLGILPAIFTTMAVEGYVPVRHNNTVKLAGVTHDYQRMIQATLTNRQYSLVCGANPRHEVGSFKALRG